MYRTPANPGNDTLIMDYAGDMAIFARVVQSKSFSAAGRRLGISTPAVSKHITRLEQRMGVRLINRTTRTLSLTEAGAEFYEHCQRLVTEIEAAESAMTRSLPEPVGTIKISCTLTFGSLYIAPLLPAFLEKYPQLKVSLSLNDRVVDLADEGFDLGIRLTARPHDALVARKLVPVHWIACASPAYLAKFGTPQTPNELTSHNCLRSQLPGNSQWQFTTPAGATTFNVNGNLQVNSGTALRDAALQGLGIIQVASYVVAKDIEEGKLQEILPEFATSTGHIYAVYLANRYLPSKVRVFIDYLLDQFTGNSF
jgi:DNA-binding transcriptional LysR family regulator